jgi:hypothetical protein
MSPVDIGERPNFSATRGRLFPAPVVPADRLHPRLPRNFAFFTSPSYCCAVLSAPHSVHLLNVNDQGVPPKTEARQESISGITTR